MSEYVFRPLPQDLADELAREATSAVGEPGIMNVDEYEECSGGPARFWQVGLEEEICVTIYAPDDNGDACAHADGVDLDSKLGKLCQRLIDEGYGYPGVPVRHQ